MNIFFFKLWICGIRHFSFPFLYSCLDYKSLGILKRQFPNAPLIGLTATATNHVLKDAQTILHVQKCITFTASFNRPNLYYEVCFYYLFVELHHSLLIFCKLQLMNFRIDCQLSIFIIYSLQLNDGVV